MENIYLASDPDSLKGRTQISYHQALHRYRTLRSFSRISWVTWSITAITVALWCITAYQVALASGAHTLQAILSSIWNNAENADVLVAYGAKENDLIRQGEYWRFITPIFLHATLLHVGLNMLNFVVLGIFLERLVGHLRFLFIYLITGIISIIASFVFMPDEVSVGASGAIFGLVGAYAIFVLMHRRAFRSGGIPALLWLVLVIGINLGIGLFVANVDNYAHIGGLVSGCLLGWWFMPLYRLSSTKALIDIHSLSRRWPLALLTVAGTLLLAIISVHITGG